VNIRIFFWLEGLRDCGIPDLSTSLMWHINPTNRKRLGQLRLAAKEVAEKESENKDFKV
jgi:hypothetical protein